MSRIQSATRELRRRKTMRIVVNILCSVMLVGASLPATAQNPPESAKPREVKELPRHEVVPDQGGSIGLFISQEGSVTQFIAGQEPATIQGAAWSQGQTSYAFTTGDMGYDAKPVKGAPYSADAVTETIQVLGDGNRIVHRNVSSIARDTEGRIRKEQSVGNVGPWTTDQPVMRVFISDPVQGVSWILDPKALTATKTIPPPPVFMRSPMPALTDKIAVAGALQEKKLNVSGGVLQGSAVAKVQPEYPPVAKAAGAQGAVQVLIVVDETGKVTGTEVISGHPLLREAALKAAQQWRFKPTELSGAPVKMQGTLTFNFTLDPSPSPTAPASAIEKAQPPPAMATAGTMIAAPAGAYFSTASTGMMIPKMEAKQEDLGKQTLEGVECVGTRIVNTIPAGAIGNERAIEIVFERWYSNDLQVVVMTRNSDPRSGETVYRLTNLVRNEPSADLFKLPSDYTVVEPSQKPMMLRRDKAPGQ